MNTQRQWIFVVIGLAVLFCSMTLFAEPMGTAFTYQGRLLDNNIAANGTYKLHVYTINGGATQNVDLSVNGGALLRSFFSHPTGLLREPLNSGDINGYQLSLGSPAIDAGKSFPEPLLTLKSKTL